MTGGANPDSPGLLFTASEQGLGGFSHHGIKKKEYFDGFDLNFILWFDFDLLILHQKDVVLLKHAKNWKCRECWQEFCSNT